MAGTQYNTVFLRLEGPLQAWGTTSRFVVRDTGDEPSKSGVLGLLCAALGHGRRHAAGVLEKLRPLRMGVRVDRPGVVWSDYHTAGAKIGITKAAGGIKKTEITGEIETALSRRDYLCDASFLVALRGAPATVAEVADALQSPIWPPYLGRKSCPPSVPVFAGVGDYPDLPSALAAVVWQPRMAEIDETPSLLHTVIEVGQSGTVLPDGAKPRMDQPLSFHPPVHEVRYTLETSVVCPSGAPLQEPPPGVAERRPDYRGAKWVKEIRPQRLEYDQELCVFCKEPARQVHHVDYARVGQEHLDDLRSLCRLCHDAITMLEYGHQFGRQRIDPCLSVWREAILSKRDEILSQRTSQHRRSRSP